MNDLRRPCREHESCQIVDRHGQRLHIHVGPAGSVDPPIESRCEHGITEGTDCEQCMWEQSVADDQATDEDYDDA